jgi:hypothetical protein
MARNIHIMGCSESSPPPTEISPTSRDAPSGARVTGGAQRHENQSATAGGQPETWEPAVHFDRLLDRILDGLVRAPST